MESSPRKEPREGASLPNLRAALEAVPGCLGVESAVTQGGKEVLFAWFRDREAVLQWYHSPLHQRTIRGIFPGYEPRGPLRDLPEYQGPILAIASLKMDPGAPVRPDVGAPIGEIAIELYAPLPGGLFLGARFAPSSLKVPGMRDYTPRT